MKTSNRKEIFVYADWEYLNGPQFMGTLYAESQKGKEIFSFEYHPDWLKSGNGHSLDPNLYLYQGSQFPSDDKINFGIFLDSSPDRWGRLLMRRREAAWARTEERPEKRLLESDYLLGVYDKHRMGGLRFKIDRNGPFVNSDEHLRTPPWTSLREMEHVSLKLEQDDAIDDPEYIKWLNMLVQPGSSLGGARPKASIVDTDGQLWFAKFPSRMDETDIGGWEMLAYQLAKLSGINIAECTIQKFSSKHHTFLTKRFDRVKKEKRLHFASAMTLLGYNDGQDFHDGISYLELAEFIIKNGANTQADLEELWRRIVFSIAISNTDDHLRNHGFVLAPKGWVLSPAYDINPVPDSYGLKLNITENNNQLDPALAMEVAPLFRIPEKRAIEIITAINKAVSKWQNTAQNLLLPRNELELMKGAFREV
ncbi:MAG: type II toxin-antitoxin system HipA family toxin [Bacteroidales bacterium]|nr:type II toxin-antitoxin system HipA family toxin [Bacteroidales bacterium]